jgi:hypothetical protein
MSLRRFCHSWRDIDAFLETVGGMTARTAHKWSNILVNRDFAEFINQERGGKPGDTFWDCYRHNQRYGISFFQIVTSTSPR